MEMDPGISLNGRRSVGNMKGRVAFILEKNQVERRLFSRMNFRDDIGECGLVSDGPMFLDDLSAASWAQLNQNSRMVSLDGVGGGEKDKMNGSLLLSALGQADDGTVVEKSRIESRKGMALGLGKFSQSVPQISGFPFSKRCEAFKNL